MVLQRLNQIHHLRGAMPQSERIAELEQRVRNLETLRDQLFGMSTAAKYGYRALLVLAGYGGINFVHHAVITIANWLNAPLVQRPH